MPDFGTWPFYSAACRRDIDALLRKGGSLSAYRANANFGAGPSKGSWAWRLERKAEEMFGADHVIACNSGTMALQAAIHAMNLPADGEVITTPYTFSATVTAIIEARLTPVFADVDTWGCLDPDSVRSVFTTATVAVLPVDLFGRVVPWLHPRDILIEDACQAVGGSTEDGRGGGLLGKVGVWSFNGGKNVPAGEAGAVVTNDENIADTVRLYVNHGENFGSMEIGFNGRINELTACVAYHGFTAVLSRNWRRRELALALGDRLGDRPDIALPDVKGHALYVYPMVLANGVDRGAFVKCMRALGVEVSEGYIRPPLHQYPAFRQYQRIPLPMVEALSERRLCLLGQVRQPATVADMRYIADCIETVLDNRCAGSGLAGP